MRTSTQRFVFRQMSKLLTLLFLIGNPATSDARAADGDLDVSFDTDGRAVASQNSAASFEVLEDIAIQPDGKIVAAGTQFVTNEPTLRTQFIVFRLNVNGSLDQTFGTGGAATINPSANAVSSAEAVAIQPDGKILVGGSGQGSFLVARLNADGSPDTTFDADGRLEITGNGGFGALALERQTGKIYAGGQGIVFSPAVGYAFTVYRLNANGSVDATFGTNGRVQTPVGFSGIGSFGNLVDGLAIQADGKIVAVGESQANSSSTITDFTVLRYNANGALDTTFDGDGIVRTTFGTARSRALEVALQTDGKIVVLGDQDQTQTNQDLTIVRYNPDGSLDNSFGTGGKAVNLGTNTNIGDLAIQPDGKIVFVSERLAANGIQTRFFVGRLTASGALDPTFGSGGSLTTEFGDTVIGNAVALQTDGKIVVGGTTTAAGQSQNQRKFGLVRYLNSASNLPVSNPALRIADFDGDGKSDVSVFRPTNGTWYLQNSTSGFAGAQFGASTDRIVPADYDGDGKTDLAVYRAGTWYLQRSLSGFTGIAFGTSDDIPVPADYDGDGKSDLAVFRPSNGTWYLQRSQLGFTGIQFGQNGDKPVAADYDGDGKTDVAVNRGGTWFIQRSQLGFIGISFGTADDKLVPADYDGDGKADVAVFRSSSGTWYIQRSHAGFTGVQFGANGDLPVPADYDGDGKADVTVFRNGTWFLNRSTQGFTGVSFGAATDKPVPNAFIQ